MTNNTAIKKWPLPVILFFCITTVLLLTTKDLLRQWDISLVVALVGNIILFAVSFVSLLLYQRAMTHDTTMGFLRNTYSGLLLKLFVCLIAVFIYAVLAREQINKGGILFCVFLYFVYALLEMRSLMQWNKDRRNA
ncbi:MAG: hypothetical protein ABI813_15890 [Bacteroidota bacterium]